MPISRRSFLATPALAAPLAVPAAAQVEPPPVPARPWRKIHLDYHNSEHMPRIADKFNADEFGDRLLAGNVDSIVVFAKDMHGYFYYPSKYGPVHPSLKMDLLGEQVKACRKRKIAVYAYYCTTWDNYLAERHPEWLVVKRDRTNYLPKFDQPPSWTAMCIAYPEFVQLMLDHTREFVSKYELDGAWFDMPMPIAGECFCHECLRQIRASGKDPFDTKAQREHKQALEIAFLKRVHETVNGARKGCQVDFNGQAVYGLRDRVKYMDNIDLEALPSAGQWGYYYFPLVVRYTRNFGVTTYGMTGRFKASWADFGGLKQPNQLITEVAGIVAHGARCDIGDQLPPDGRLDPAVYHVIGKAYGHIKSIEPYLEGAMPVAEAAMLISGLPTDWPNTDPHVGLTKVLSELRVQFDAVEPDTQWERYKLIVLPDESPVSAATAARLDAFIAKGGAVIAVHKGGLLEGGETSWLEKYGFGWKGMSKFAPAYMVPKVDFTGGIPSYPYALYSGASQWSAGSGVEVYARLGEPLFQRSGAKYTSHAQTPFDHETEFAVLARSGRVGLVGFPLGASYMKEGYWVYRAALEKLVRALLPTPLIESSAPLSTEVTLTHQPAVAGRRERWLVHVVNWSATRGTPRHPVFHEDPIALTNITVKLNRSLANATARAVVAGRDLPIRRGAGAMEVTLDRVAIHEIVSFEVA